MPDQAIELKTPLWNNRSILNENDVNRLERDSAVLEFGEKRLPRDKAEETAYQNYTLDQRRQAAAHHLVGLKIAQAAGAMDEARRHSLMYGMHVQALGLNPLEPPPPEITSIAEQLSGGEGKSQYYKFKAHPGDFFAVVDRKKPEESVEKVEAKFSDLLDALVKMEEEAEELKKGGWPINPGEPQVIHRKGRPIGSTSWGDKKYEGTDSCRRCKGYGKRMFYDYSTTTDGEIFNSSITSVGCPSCKSTGREIPGQRQEQAPSGGSSPSVQDPYSVLGLKPGVAHEQIKSAYKNLAMKTHPDRNPNDPQATEKMKRINIAYGKLMGKSELFDALMSVGEELRKAGDTPPPTKPRKLNRQKRIRSARAKLIALARRGKKAAPCRCNNYSFPHREHSRPGQKCPGK